MARKNNTHSKPEGRLHRAANAVKRLFSRREENTGVEMRDNRKVEPQPQQRTAGSRKESAETRVPRRSADIPLETLDRAYTPAVTSSKASFRSDGADHQSDQEYAYGVADERWNDEDRLTNKSGDPRIGTHRRTYEPGEARTESRD